MSDSTFTRTINIYIDSGQAQAAYNTLVEKQAGLNTKLDELKVKYEAALSKAAVEGTQKAKDAAQRLGQQLQETQAKVDGNTAAMDRLSKKISGELSASLKDLQATSRKLNQELNQMSHEDAGFALKKEQAVAAKKAVDDYLVSIGRTKSAAHEGSGIGEIFKIATGVGVESIAEKGIELIKDGLKESLDEAIKEEDIKSRLQNSLEGVGRLDLFGPLEEKAEELGKKFKFVLPDDIKDTEDRLVTFGKLSKNQIDDLLPVIINFAAKTRKSLPDATDAMLKAFSGLEGMDKPFHKLGVELDKNGSFAANFSAIMGQLAPKVDGAGEALSRTAKGATEEFSVMFTEFKKWLGEGILPFFTGVMQSIKTLFGPSESLVDSFRKQNEQVKNLTANVEPLLNRYDELKGKTTLTKTEQDELKKIIEKVGGAIPGAITQFDQYGKAMDISTKAAKDFIKEQQKILAVKNEGAIKKAATDLEDTQKTIKVYLDQLKDGTKFVSAANSDVEVLEKLSDDDIRGLQSKIKGLTDRKIGLQGILRELKGELEEKNPDDDKALDKNYKKFDLTKITGIQEKLQSLNDELKSTTIGSDAFKKLQEEIKATDKLLQEALGKVKDSGDEWKKFLEKISNMRAEAAAKAQSADAAELEKLKEKFTALEEEEKKFFTKGAVNKAGYLATLAQIQKIYAQELIELQDKQYADRGEKEYAAAEKALQEFYITQKDIVKRAYAEQQIGKDEYDRRTEVLDRESKQALLTNFITFEAEKIEAAKGDKDKLANIEAQKVKLQNDLYNQDTQNYINAQARKDAAVNNQDKADVITTGMGADPLAKQQARLKQLDDELAQKLAKIKDNEAAINEAMAEYAQQRQAIQKQTYDAIAQDIKQYGSDAVKIFSDIAQIEANIQNAKLAEDKHANQVKEQNLKAQLDAGRLSQAQYNAAISAMRKQELAEENKVAKEQFSLQKGLKIAQAIVNTAAGVTQALSSQPPPLSYVMAAISGAMGAAEIGVIASQKFVPKYESGTDSIANGPSHAQGGIKMMNSLTGEHVGELEGNEAIISASTTRANQSLIQSLLRANGRPVINATRAIENNRIAAGNYTQSVAGNTEVHNHTSNPSADIQELIGHVITLTGVTRQAQNKKVINVKDDYDKFAADQTIIYNQTL